MLAPASTLAHLQRMDEPAPLPKDDTPQASPPPEPPKEIGGATGPDPTRYGDWQHKGRVTDF